MRILKLITVAIAIVFFSQGFCSLAADEVTDNIQKLSSDVPLERIQAANMLGELQDRRALQPLLQALDDREPDVREGAADALGNIRDPQAVDALCERLEDPSAATRTAAAEALGKIGDKRAITALKRAFRNNIGGGDEPGFEGVSNAIEDALRKMDMSASLDDIEWELNDYLQQVQSNDPAVRGRAIGELARLSDPRASDAILRALQDPDHDVRASAMVALQEARDEAAIEPLINRMNNEKDVHTRILARNTLQTIAGDDQRVKDAIKAADIEGKFDVGGEPTPAQESTQEAGLDQWEEYSLTEFSGTQPEELNQDSYTILKALDEIGQMIQEVDFAFQQHKSALENPRFMASYYVKRANLPESELGKGIMKFNQDNELEDFPEWLAHELAGASDIAFGGSVLPGLSRNNGKLMHIDDVKSKLSQSLNYLTRNSQNYQDQPPLQEMQYLRDMMDEWRSIVAGYHNSLDAFLENVAQWTVLLRYHNTYAYQKKREEIEQKYAGRKNNEIMQAKYDVEINNLNGWRDKNTDQANQLRKDFTELHKGLWMWEKEELPATLNEEFTLPTSGRQKKTIPEDKFYKFLGRVSAQNTSIFKQAAESHPGVEHEAGPVEQGTLILINPAETEE